MNGRFKFTDKEESSRRLKESQRNQMFSPENLASVEYCVRDLVFLKNEFHKLAEYENVRMLKYIFKFTNRNVTLYDLMGTKHPNANLQTHY